MLRGLAETQAVGLTMEQRGQFYSLLLTYANIFASSNSNLERTDKLSYSIHTRDATPVRQPVCRIPPHRRQEVQSLLDEMLEQDVLQQSTSPWASLIVLVREKDGTTQITDTQRCLPLTLH